MAAGLRFTSFAFVHSVAVAYAALDRGVEIGLLGVSRAAGLGTHAWQLAFSIGTYFERSGHWRDWTRAARVALMAAQQTGDTSGQAHTHQQLTTRPSR